MTEPAGAGSVGPGTDAGPRSGSGSGERVAIVGSGLAGCLLATLLARRGIEVTVYERRPDPRVTGPERGRSINLAISARGLEALDQVGLRELALSRALPMHGRMVHSVTGEPGRPAGKQSFRPYSADGSQAINSISRAELNLALLEAAASTPGVCLKFSSRLTGLDTDTGTLTFDAGSGPAEAKADVVLAADGSWSVARRSVTFRPGFTFSQDYLEHGYKELTIPAVNGDFALDPDALHIWPRGSSMMIALPNLDRSFTCTLFWTGEEFAALSAEPPAAIVGHFRNVYPDVVDLMPTLAEDFALNPVGSLATIRCWPWVHRGDGAILALVGDAAHAIVPFYGQGANCALEDCVEIERCLSSAGGSWTEALPLYAERRKANCDAIAEMALDNFVEMRDKVNSPVFRAVTAGRHFLERRLPGRYVSQYELVSFSTMPYSRIRDRMRRQDRATVLAAAGVAGLAGLLAAGARGASGALRRRTR
ncbi:MAG: FAD-dependent monooxygenase [Nocardiopsaceae bacterium]|nr:FAD-dependent monooxygenase [Nocardiopsaceae bacterium]